VEYVGNAHDARQCACGSFQRATALPSPVDAERAEAFYRNGVLTIRLPKTGGAQPLRIAVQ
jgi:HSP20 family protein